MIKPLSAWQSSLEDKIKKAGEDKGTVPIVTDAWQSWITENAQGIALAPPYSLSTGTLPPKTAFAPLPMSLKPGNPAMAAMMYSTAWFAWYNSITFKPCPPLPPFSVIQMIIPSPMGAMASKTVLYSSLLAEFSSLAGAETKLKRIAGYFYTATMAAGAQIMGLAIGAPPPPLVIPLVPIQ